jgi:hypothetical protein
LPLFLTDMEINTMSAKKGFFLKIGILASGAVLALFAFGPYAAANPVRINFSAAGGSGYADLMLGGTNPADVVDASHPPLTITDASGMFNGVTITGIQPLNHATPPPGEVLPAAYSLFSIPGYGDHDGVSYDNLFYVDGSPLICLVDGTPVYPFSGGFLDLMGIMFTLDDGTFLDLWSFGVTPPGFFGPDWTGGLAYGMKLVQPNGDGFTVVDLGPSVAVVPEPGWLWLFGAGLVGLFAWRRSLEKKRVPVTR